MGAEPVRVLRIAADSPVVVFVCVPTDRGASAGLLLLGYFVVNSFLHGAIVV